jgi:hypothetical protein
MHSDLEGVNRCILLDQACCTKVIPCLFVYLPNCAVKVVFVFVDLPSGKTPTRSLFVPPNEYCSIHRIVEHDSSSDGHSGLVLHKLVEGFEVYIGGEGREKWAVLEHL